MLAETAVHNEWVYLSVSSTNLRTIIMEGGIGLCTPKGRLLFSSERKQAKAIDPAYD